MNDLEMGDFSPPRQSGSSQSSTNVDGECTTLVNGNENENASFAGDVPYKGLEFPTDVEAYNYYNSYARKIGFGIRKEAADKSRKSSVGIIGRTFVCNRAGRKSLSDKREGGKSVSRRPDTRVGCPAKMTVRLTPSKTWMVAKFVGEHKNHELSSPSKVSNHYSHKLKNQRQECTNCTGSSRKVPHIATSELDIRKNNVNSEWVPIFNIFQDRSGGVQDFYFSFNLDHFPKLGSMFWADPRSKSDYLRFGDLVVFDISYNANNSGLPFASFTGVNHHRQPILFGCGLIADEQEVTFIWLFTELLKCMHGIAPKSIITNDDTHIREAIKKVFPDTRHRFSWHINKNIAEQEVLLNAQYGHEFSVYFNNWCQASTICKCDKHWEALKKKFDIKENAEGWLPKMYKLRAHWVEAYLKDNFWAGMTTNPKSGTIGAFFDSFISSKTRLVDFVHQYDKALEARRASESKEDSVTLNTAPTMCFSHPIEKQAARLYTRNILKIFQKEFTEGLALFHEKVIKEGLKTVHLVGYFREEKVKWEEVICDQSGDLRVKCTCAMFETDGIFCRHILHILHYNQLRSIPDNYILHRWRIEARRRNIGPANVMNFWKMDNNTEQCKTLKKWALRAKFNEVLEMISGSDVLLSKLDNMLEEFIVEAEKDVRLKMLHSGSSGTGSQVGSSTPEVL